jgi:YggT family protein
MSSSGGKTAQWVQVAQMLLALVIGLIEIILIFRFVLRLLNASPSAEIVSWVLQNSAPFLRPFAFAFTPLILPGGFTIEFTTLFAIFAYAVIGYVIREAMNMMK